MATTIEATVRSGEDARDGRFFVAGRLLALARVVHERGRSGGSAEWDPVETRDWLLLTTLAEIVAAEGVNYGRGWLEGLHHTAGVRVHETWTAAREILA